MHNFTLTDADGQTNNYSVQPHPAREGTRLVLQVMSLAAEPLGRLLESKLAGVMEQFASGDIDLDADVEDVVTEQLADIQWHAIAGDLRRVLAELDSQELIRSVLKYTTRNGQSLADDGAFDTAYQQNYLEMLKAVAQVIRINGFLGFTGSLTSE